MIFKKYSSEIRIGSVFGAVKNKIRVISDDFSKIALINPDNNEVLSINQLAADFPGILSYPKLQRPVDHEGRIPWTWGGGLALTLSAEGDLYWFDKNTLFKVSRGKKDLQRTALPINSSDLKVMNNSIYIAARIDFENPEHLVYQISATKDKVEGLIQNSSSYSGVLSESFPHSNSYEGAIRFGDVISGDLLIYFQSSFYFGLFDRMNGTQKHIIYRPEEVNIKEAERAYNSFRLKSGTFINTVLYGVGMLQDRFLALTSKSLFLMSSDGTVLEKIDNNLTWTQLCCVGSYAFLAKTGELFLTRVELD